VSFGEALQSIQANALPRDPWLYAAASPPLSAEVEQTGFGAETGKEKLPPEVLEYFRRQGSKGGKIGGSKAWENLTAEERSARAKKAVAAREAKRAQKKSVRKQRPGT
jgi:hypothetical protein